MSKNVDFNHQLKISQAGIVNLKIISLVRPLPVADSGLLSATNGGYFRQILLKLTIPFFGILDWSVDYYTHKNIDGEPDLYENTKPVERQGYMTDLITERAVAFINRQAREPFFAYVAYNAMVSPIQPPDKPNDIRTRETWNQATREDYVRMVERVDEGVGSILKALDRDGLARDTLVIFTNDHGGQWYSRREPMFHGFGTIWEGGIRVPYLLRWPGHLPAGRISHQPIITMDLTASILGATGTTPAKGLPLRFSKTGEPNVGIRAAFRRGWREEGAPI